MNPARLPGRTITGGGAGGSAVPAPAPVVAPAPVPTPARPAPVPVPAPAPAQQPQPFTGLDPLTRSLIEAAPLVPATPAPVSTPTEPPTQHPLPAVVRRTLKQPAILVALGGTLAAGLLFLSGAVKPRLLGHPRTAGQSPGVVTTPQPILPAAVPAPSSWLIAGGRA